MNLAQTLYPNKGAKLIYMSDCSSQRITIYQSDKYTWLLVSGVVQSAIENRLPYRPIVPYCFVMLLPILHHKIPDTILELGAGGLSIQRYLSYAHPSIRITSVDESSDVLKAVDSFFPPIHKPSIVHKNAFKFIDSAEKNEMKFDWILTDLFHGKESSILMKTKNFYEQLFELINPNGWLIINCLTNDEKEIEQLTEYLKCIFNNKSYVFPIPEMMNKVLMVNKINDFNFPPEIEIYNTVE